MRHLILNFKNAAMHTHPCSTDYDRGSSPWILIQQQANKKCGWWQRCFWFVDFFFIFQRIFISVKCFPK